MTHYSRLKSTEKFNLDNLQENSIAFVIPIAVDGSVQHAIAVAHHPNYGMLVFDSNDEHPIKYSKNALDFCCGEFDGIHSAIEIIFEKGFM